MNAMIKKTPCPRDLKGKGRRYWKQVVNRCTFEDYELPILEATCKLLTKFHASIDVIEKDGPLYTSTRGQKIRPEVGMTRDCWRGFLAGVKALGLDVQEEQEQAQLGRRPGDPRQIRQGAWK